VLGRICFTEYLKSPDRGTLVHIILEDFRQRCNGIVEVEVVTEAVDDFQILNERSKVLGPEHKTGDIIWSQRHEIPAAPERVHDTGETLIEPAHEPVAVKCRDIGPARN
jgi:hypothetical protein